MLPTHSVLGQLEFLETYDYFDIPLLFTCRNRAGHTFFAVFTGETGEAYTWFYVAVSSDRLRRIRHSEIDTREAFSSPETGIGLRVSIFKDPERDSQVTQVQMDELNPDWLPRGGDYLELELQAHVDIVVGWQSVTWQGVITAGSAGLPSSGSTISDMVLVPNAPQFPIRSAEAARTLVPERARL